MKKGAALALIGAMSALGAPYMDFKIKSPKQPKYKMPLTDEEEVKLLELSGREKKAYVKTLKAKYYVFLYGNGKK